MQNYESCSYVTAAFANTLQQTQAGWWGTVSSAELRDSAKNCLRIGCLFCAKAMCGVSGPVQA